MTDMKKLQSMIDKTAKTATDFHRAQFTLNEWCLETYGKEPGDLDADEIIDAVFGGCGEARGMCAKDFDEIMRRLTNERP